MSVIYTYSSMKNKILEIIQDKPKFVHIATFGLYVGIVTDERHKRYFNSKVFNYLTANKINAKVLIGTGTVLQRNSNKLSPDVAKDICKYELYELNWPHIKFKYHPDLHAKIIVTDNIAIIGSFNFHFDDTNEPYMPFKGYNPKTTHDIAYVVDNTNEVSQINRIFNNWWSEAYNKL